jgi:transcriptional regulator with XRE-family HTH domain
MSGPYAAAMGHPAPRLHPTRAFAVSMRTLRTAAGLTQQQLAAATGLPTGTIPKLERHYRRANVGAAVLIARALGTTVEAMVTDAPLGDVTAAPIGRPRRGASAEETNLDREGAPSRGAEFFRSIFAARAGEDDHELRAAVAASRAAGDSWEVIATVLGTSRQTAAERFGR